MLSGLLIFFSEGGGEENVGITIILPVQRDGQRRSGIAVYYS